MSRIVNLGHVHVPKPLEPPRLRRTPASLTNPPLPAHIHPNLISAHTQKMGNDGGSIPKRNELVKEAAKALTTAQIKEAQNEQQEYAWSTDPLTRKPLARPVVSDAAGHLYNKDSIIEFLLKDDDDAEKTEMRVKGLKDVVEVKFEIEKGEEGERGEKWVCPITGLRLGPGSKGVYLVPCGHAFAGSVVKEVAGSVCLTVSLSSVLRQAGKWETAGLGIES
jgi:hypothetical protein